jgi:integrase
MLDLPLAMPNPCRARSQATGTKRALKPVQVWGIRIRLQVQQRLRDLALFDLALDSKLRGCDLVALKVSDVVSSARVRSRAMILQRKTGRPVQFEITQQNRRSLAAWIEDKDLGGVDWLFPSRSKKGARCWRRRFSLSSP